MRIHRARYGIYGIAVKKAHKGNFMAWGCLGKTKGDNPIMEPSRDVWVQFGITQEEAVAKLKQELDEVRAAR